MTIIRNIFLISIIFMGNIFSTQAQRLFDLVPKEIEFEHKVISSVFSLSSFSWFLLTFIIEL